MSDSTAVAKPADYSEVRNLLQRLEIESSLESDNRQAQLSIIQGLLAAESEEELFERQEAGTISSKDFLGRPFRLLPENIAWKKSASQYVEAGGFPFYALLQVTDIEKDEGVVLDAGGYTVVSILDKLMQFDDESRPMEKRSFEPYRGFGGRALVFDGKPATNGTVVLLKPYHIPGEGPAKKSRRSGATA